MTPDDEQWLEQFLQTTPPRRRQAILYKALHATGLRIGASLDTEIESLSLGHEVDWSACSRDGVWICSHCKAMYCSPPWSKAAVERERCEARTAVSCSA